MAKKIKEKYYDIVIDKDNRSAEILLYAVIGNSFFEESVTARQFVSEFRNLEKDCDLINIRINSPGGSIFDGLAIFNAISASKKEIHTYNDGVCASMASVILEAVPKDRIHPAKNSLFMLHSPSTGAWGNRQQIASALDVLDKCQMVLITSICDKTGMDASEVEKKYFDYQDHWFTADEAMKAGFYSKIEDTEAENVPQNASTMKYSDLIKYFEPKNSIMWPEQEADDEPEDTTDTNFFIDMDIKKLTAAYKLPEDSTEDAVIAHIAKREQEIADLTTAKAKAYTDLAAANKTIQEKDAEIVDLKKTTPGAQSATAPVDTDPKHADQNKDPEPAKDFGTAFADCMSILNPKK